jgi:hypothetical protein
LNGSSTRTSFEHASPSLPCRTLLPCPMAGLASV